MEAIDCATRLNDQTASALKEAGLVAVCRYLGCKTEKWSKTLTPSELQTIHKAGLSVVLIWESDPTYASYFNYAKGLSDAKQAVLEAEYLGAPKETAIYFTVDFDAQTSNLAAIMDYFHGVRDSIDEYLVGAYGSFTVMNGLKESAYAPDRYWQTYAWSGGSVFAGNIFQYQNSVNVGGVTADRDKLNAAPGAWPAIGGLDVLNVAVLLNSDSDFWDGADVALKNGNCAIFVRSADLSVPADAMSAKKLMVVGGATTGHPNEVLLSGRSKYETAAAVAKYLGY
jgi:hypothetical protein